MSDWNDLVPSREVGLVFTVICDRGFAVGTCTHRHAQLGHLILLAEDFFNDFPTIEQVQAIQRWRWPVFFPLGAALRRKLVDRVGRIPVPGPLTKFPTMRNGGLLGQPWMAYTDGGFEGLGPTTGDRTLPIEMIVNDTRLKEMLVTGWMPSDQW